MTSENTNTLEDESNISVLNKTPVFLAIILSIITLGIYLPYWFLTRRKYLNQFKSDEIISFVTPFCLLLLYSFIALTIIPVNLYGEGWTFALYNYLDIVVTYLGFTIILYLSFQIKAILSGQEEEKRLSSLATFFFHIWYLQYRINKHN